MENQIDAGWMDEVAKTWMDGWMEKQMNDGWMNMVQRRDRQMAN